MPLVLPTSVLPVGIALDRPLTDDELLEVCQQNEVFHVERLHRRQAMRRVGEDMA